MTEIDWRKLAGILDFYSSEENGPLLHEFYTWIVDQLDEDDVEPEHCLEMGCGTALLASKLVDWYPETRFTLVDQDGSMLEIARERLGDEESVSIHESGCEEFLAGLDDDAADMAVFCRSWYALADPRRAAAELVRVVKSGGMVFIYEFEDLIDFEAMDASIAEQDREKWEVLRSVSEEFNEGVRSGRYSLSTEQDVRDIWAGVGAEVRAFESHGPMSPTCRMCIRVP
jgi:ubiquinone/menaquinone biosynthesis C-methylase UbiE